jgi:hypothetical protein
MRLLSGCDAACGRIGAYRHYGSETLMRVLCKRILDPARFDYFNISIAVNSKQNIEKPLLSSLDKGNGQGLFSFIQQI